MERRATYVHFFLYVVIAIIAPFGCRDQGENPTAANHSTVPLVLNPTPSATLNVNNFRIDLDSAGQLKDGIWLGATPPISIVCRAGLWVGVTQDGIPTGTLVQSSTLRKSNYTSRWGQRQMGVFLADRGIIDAVENWPISFGAPVTQSGTPRLYGDAMCWAALTSDTTIAGVSILANPVKSLRVNEALYAYRDADLQDVIFIRYAITNNSSRDWTSAYVGFYADTDLGDPRMLVNRTGYDSIRSMSYTYADTLRGSTSQEVIGYTFVETPHGIGATSHRICYKDNLQGDFSEATFKTARQILFALQGLSDSGLPMINPITGMPTPFAFTGDPITRTGWLDKPYDVRSLLNCGPFQIKAGETQVLTVVWAVATGADLRESLGSLRDKIDAVRSRSNLWDFQ